ncbi:MAG: LacI family transcriptional regulator [Propionibacteriaceae bacterium]|nr:LacI family transcriptional regulator [Propionibacteriaceae bacterium]
MPIRINQRPTQRQIAARVGVSVTTVSRILNPSETHPERWASPETIEAIREVAEVLGYRRNSLAVSLRTSRSQTIGVFLPVIGDYTLASIFAGIDDVAREHGIMALTASTLDTPGLRSDRAMNMLDHLVDGIIGADAHLGERYLGGLDAQRVPIVLVHRRHDDHVSVTADDVAAGQMAARHLISLGRTRLAVIIGRRYMSTGVDRAAGFVQTALEAGLEEPVVYDHGFTVQAGREAALAMIGRESVPDGLFGMHDLCVLGATSVLRQHGYVTGEDVAAVGVYDSPVAGACDLSSIGIGLHNMGRRSLELLLDRLGGSDIESETLPVHLTVRASSDPSLQRTGHTWGTMTPKAPPTP